MLARSGGPPSQDILATGCFTDSVAMQVDSEPGRAPARRTAEMGWLQGCRATRARGVRRAAVTVVRCRDGRVGIGVGVGVWGRRHAHCSGLFVNHRWPSRPFIAVFYSTRQDFSSNPCARSASTAPSTCALPPAPRLQPAPCLSSRAFNLRLASRRAPSTCALPPAPRPPPAP
jgi:hypothetical protein